jgi:hypothetical protein
MHTIEIPEAEIKRYIPSDLSECDQEQYIDMCELIFRFQNQEINYDEFRIHAAYKLMKMKPSKAANPELQTEEQKQAEACKFANIYMVSELINDFFEEDEKGIKTIKQHYIHNPVPKFKPLHKTYYGPSDSFINMTFGEYTDGLRMFLDFHATGDMEILKLLTALFYRPKKSFNFIQKRLDKYDGDIRERYKSHSLENRAKALNYAPIGFVYGFYLLFASFQKYLIDAKIMWGGQEIDFSILFESSTGEESSTNQVPGIGMDSIAFSIAESGAFGNIEQVRNTNFWQIMVRMYDLRRTDLERQKKETNAANK